MTETDHQGLPFAGRDDGTVQGHWLLARMGKRVLRPGGAELTRRMLAGAQLGGADVVELAPGLGRTAAEIVAAGPKSYRGVDQDAAAVEQVREVVAGHGEVTVADAAATGLEHDSADVVVGEAMLTMQGEGTKGAIIREAVRVLRPGGRYAIHELGLEPDDLPDAVKSDIRQALARSIRVNARPLTIAEWQALLTAEGLVVDDVETAPMALLQPRRLVADEGVRGALRFAANVIRNPQARKRILAMRRTFRTHRDHLVAVAVIAHKPGGGLPGRQPAMAAPRSSD